MPVYVVSISAAVVVTALVTLLCDEIPRLLSPLLSFKNHVSTFSLFSEQVTFES
jgi:hypothetical protein